MININRNNIDISMQIFVDSFLWDHQIDQTKNYYFQFRAFLVG